MTPDPDCEARLPEVRRAADAGAVGGDACAGKDHALPVLVEQRAPRPVEGDREAERERFEPEAVRRAAVLQAEAGDLLCAVYERRRLQAGFWIGVENLAAGHRVDLGAQDDLTHLVRAVHKLEAGRITRAGVRRLLAAEPGA